MSPRNDAFLSLVCTMYYPTFHSTGRYLFDTIHVEALPPVEKSFNRAKNDANDLKCLAQADLSPLHYRHGAIIVRGGKVIGQGFNCYRPGFDGGALKSGALPSSSRNGPALAELKQWLKSKPKSKSKMHDQPDEGTFTPFESIGCGHNSNVALSMHSEMMAIRSALSLSSGAQACQTSARSAKCFEKPYRVILKNAKPEREASKPTPKRPARRPLPQELATPPVASSAFKSRVLNPVHLNQVNLSEGNRSNEKEENEDFRNKDWNEDVAANTWRRGDKHRAKKISSSSYEDGYQFEGHYHHQAPQKQHPHKRGSGPPQFPPTTNNISTTESQVPGTADDLTSSPKARSKPSSKITTRPQPLQILITKNKATSKPTAAARTKDLRLKGSDLYVARLGNSNRIPPSVPKPQSNCAAVAGPPSPPTESTSPPSSLYDELSPRSRSTSSSPFMLKHDLKTLPRPEIRASRPCYRCVTAMHSVGIKRVFWTTQGGEWEGAKVRDLVDALEVGIEGDGNADGHGRGTGPENKGVFVTKHEVLMLKRAMGF
ncbi:hypothetical protein QTJ16_004129 [Diplocarpon rosae]|uniref:CMP/dCMP-type deaminase domain-containing protein n=1 Tax=Diplocarpon rosae TaxID=946125 RepID=A0AAD9T1D5_9HELO|nr:hypothetical protein QTJ16_004129 [Diplocarpon rosae]